MDKPPTWVVPLPSAPPQVLPATVRDKLLKAAIDLVEVRKTQGGAALIVAGVVVCEGESDAVLDLCLKVRQTVGEGLLQAAAVAKSIKAPPKVK